MITYKFPPRHDYADYNVTHWKKDSLYYIFAWDATNGLILYNGNYNCPYPIFGKNSCTTIQDPVPIHKYSESIREELQKGIVEKIPENVSGIISKLKDDVKILKWVEVIPMTEELSRYYDPIMGWGFNKEDSNESDKG